MSAQNATIDRSVQFETWAWRIVFGSLLVASAALVLAYRYLPFVDWPEHLAQDAIVAHMHNPAYGVARYYRTGGWFLPYLGFRWIHVSLAWVFGIGAGGRIALLGYVVGAPLAIVGLLRRFGRDRWIAVAAFTVLVEANLLWGFAPYVIAAAISLAAFALAIDYGREGGAWRIGILVIAGVALFFTHPQQTAQYLLVLGGLALVAWQRKATSTTRAMALIASGLPAGLMLSAYLLFSGWIDGSVLRDAFAITAPTVWRSPQRTLRLFPLSSGLTAWGRTPWKLYLFALTALVAGDLVLRYMQRTQREPGDVRNGDWGFAGIAVAASWVVMAFGLPAEFRGQTISPRLASAAMLGLLWVPRLGPGRARREQWIARVIYAAVSAAAIASLVVNHVAFARFDRSMRPLDSAIAHVPNGSRVATLVYEISGEGWRLPVYLHMGGYVVAERGGMASSGFTRTGVDYAPTVPPEALLVNQIWMPSIYGWQMDLDRYGPYYDYVLVRTGRGYPGTPFAEGTSSRRRGVRIVRNGAIELWRIEPVDTASRR